MYLSRDDYRSPDAKSYYSSTLDRAWSADDRGKGKLLHLVEGPTTMHVC